MSMDSVSCILTVHKEWENSYRNINVRMPNFSTGQKYSFPFWNKESCSFISGDCSPGNGERGQSWAWVKIDGVPGLRKSTGDEDFFSINGGENYFYYK